jgi:UDP-N-acetyl-D-glucosamine dehydrogenase
MNLNRTVAVVGQGYVGLPLALAASQAGWQVIGLEIDETRLSLLQSGVSPVEDVSNEKLQEALASKVYVPTSEIELISSCSIVILCVPTPIDAFHAPDLSLLESAIALVAKHLRPGTLLINESTSHVGTLRNFVRLVLAKSLDTDVDGIELASAPERIDPGNSVWKIENTPRLVSGLTTKAHQVAVDFYRSFTSTVIEVSSPEVAEMAKLLENTFRLVNISLVNELSILAEAFQIDMRDVVTAAASKPYGYMPFYPGPGIGGHCIPVDPYYLLYSLRENNLDSTILESSLEVNAARPGYVLKRALELAEGTMKILLCGVAYKSGVSDYRESAAEKLAAQAQMRGIKIYWLDTLVDFWPFAPEWQGEEVDVVIFMVDQPEMQDKAFAPNKPILDCTGKLMTHPLVFHL